MTTSNYISPYKLFNGTGDSSTDYYELIYRTAADRNLLVKNITVNNISNNSGDFAIKWKNTTVGMGTTSNFLAMRTPINAYETVPVFSQGFIYMDYGDELWISGSTPLNQALYVLVSAMEQTTTA